MKRIMRKRPIRTLRQALGYWFPHQLTYTPVEFAGLPGIRHAYAWLWWNFTGSKMGELQSVVNSDPQF